MAERLKQIENRLEITERYLLSLYKESIGFMQHCRKIMESCDAWIKRINVRLSEMEGMDEEVDGHEGNIQHNYELILELRDDMERLREEMKMVKGMGMLQYRKRNKI